MIGLVNANALTIPLRDNTVQCAVMSPPYWGLRDYGTATWEGGSAECDHLADRGNHEKNFENSKQATSNGTRSRDGHGRQCPKCGAVRIDAQIGLEPTPAAYVANIVAVMREVWRVLKDDGTVWLNLGDSYASGEVGRHDAKTDREYGKRDNGQRQQQKLDSGLKPKDLCGIPWRVAFALQDDGWYLRSDIIWHKPNPMPESVTDRPTKAHEYVFLLSKQARYFYDAEAIKESAIGEFNDNHRNHNSMNGKDGVTQSGGKESSTLGLGWPSSTRNARSVWTIATSPYSGAHYATMPPELARRCVLAGTSQRGECPVCGKALVRVVDRIESDDPNGYNGSKFTNGKTAAAHPNTGNGKRHESQSIGWRAQCTHDAAPVPQIVIDPFCGSGTTGEVCRETLRSFFGLDLSLKYLHENALPRAAQTNTQASMATLPMFAESETP